ncbi:hypothetical protein PF66_06375 [Pseudomonas asplenii]|uniref:DUF1566 domain-containing protein n=1 Tax=Pseudomonas asplenii TaxID=53407 RepID=A0A0M9GBJ0_9PSED|nr:DUF1566 domain-containing protein [Pseudomonas fuscovaginae]KPA87030.1 hypothetical protein PF66_06375 [Pseudomonas fuscovaginae]
MKPEMVTLKVGEATIKMPAATVAGLVLASVVSHIAPSAQVAANGVASDIPETGSYWPEQGGLNGGFVPPRGDVPAHYLIFAKDDVGDHEYGRRGEESKATSKTDGMSNSTILLSEGGHPAAIAASGYSADGHNDFYLPAAAELYQGWVNCPQIFAQDCYYWSSSQRSANDAFLLFFADGYQDVTVKTNELRVRPVRRFFI